MEEVLKVSVARQGTVPVITAGGEIDVATAPLLRDELNALPEDEGTVVVDLTDVTFIDSTGIGVLIAALKRLRNAQEDGSVRLVVTRPQISKVLEVTGLKSMFTIVSTLEEAVAS